ncbi:MAG: hypothetical protein IT234_04615 [Bacteroidia bacterium]|nr:hypothetical protein [Bacteroidia bacterium]
MQCKFNKFTKKPDSKTAFVLVEGEAIFTESLYLLKPIYIHKRSPAFTLVSKGKHVSGFFEACGGSFIGDFDKKALIIFQRESGFDLFKTDLSPVIAKQLLCSGDLNDQLFEARQAAI